MNTSSAVPPTIPQEVLSNSHSPDSPPLGDLPGDREPISNPASAVEAMLREPRRVLFHLRQPGAGALIGVLLLIFILCSAVYGFVVGTFSGGVQLWAAPLKVTLGLLFAALICLPSLYIFACLGGSRARVIEVAGLVMGLLTMTTVLLIGFAPVAWVFSQSTQSVVGMGSLHLVFGIVAAWFGLRFLNWGFSQLGTSTGSGIGVWMVMFVIVVLQMTTALRPIVGTADTLLPAEKKFFVRHWLDNLEQNRK